MVAYFVWSLVYILDYCTYMGNKIGLNGCFCLGVNVRITGRDNCKK